MVCRRAVLLFLVVATAQAQFSGLSSTDAGASVYFASPLRERGTDQFLWSKIFSIDANGAALVAQVAQSSPVPPTNAYILDQPQVSGDGTLLLYRGTLNCGCCSSCFLSEQHDTTLLNTNTGQTTAVRGNARLSRNGRYMAIYNSPNVIEPQFMLVDRTTGSTLYQGTLSPATVSIAADGTTALTVDNALQVISGGTRTTLIDSGISAAVINDAATTIVYETQGPKRLFVMDVKSGQTQELGPGDRDSFQATLSADGQWVGYLSTLGTIPQVFFSKLDGSDWEQLTNESGVVEATLSGDAKTIFAIGVDGSMLRIDTASGNITTLVGPTPAISSVQATTPGSLTSIEGTGLGDPSLTIDVSGLPCPVLSRSASEILFQVPWEAPLTADAVSIPQGGSPYFDDTVPLQIEPFIPEPIILAPTEPATGTQPFAIHTDWSGLVTDENPAVPGETVHIYLTGGGPVSPPVATDTPAPVQPLSLVTTPFSVVTGSPTALQVPYFGLAPDLVGVWQMDVTLPSAWSQTYLFLEIQYNSPPPNSFAESVTFPSIPMKAGALQ